MNWQETGNVAPGSLAPARLQLHYGAYILGSAAHSVLPHAADDSHSNLGFDARRGSLFTRDLAPGLRLHLDFVPFELVLRTDSNAVAFFPLSGRTLDGALRWIGEALVAARGTDSKIARRAYPDFPESPIMGAGAFARPATEELTEHCLWFGNAVELIESLRPRESRMSDARVWPHHFDLGALIPVTADGSATVGIGYSPGDHSFDQPYFYCSPYPAPATSELPELKVGKWTTGDFTSAILTAGEIQKHGSQRDAAQQYMTGAVARCREILRDDTA